MKKAILLIAFVLSAQTNPSRVTWTALSATGTTAQLAVPGNDVHTVQVIVTGSPASCTLHLEGSLDSTHWADLSGDQTCTSNLMFHVTSRGVSYVRGNLTALSAAATATISYLGHSTGR